MTNGYKVTTYTILAHQKLQKKLPTDWQEKDTDIDQARTSQIAELRGWPPGWHSWTSELNDVVLMTGEV